MSDRDSSSETEQIWARAEARPDAAPDDGPTKPAKLTVGVTKVEVETPKVGALIAGRYRLARLLGKGGMGAVYLADDLSQGRPIALKLLHPRMADNLAVVHRFRREARIMRDLRSPHAVLVRDFGQAEDGSLYLAMEYLEGETLGALLDREGALPPLRVAEIALELLSVLEDAHRLGIIHRDLKPANVFLARTPKGGDPTVKLLDFGIAKLHDHEATELTSTGAVWGTPKYMSPEQVKGKPVDVRSDIYSLGIVLYRALTGAAPFEAETALELMYAHIHTPPERPSKRRPDAGIPLGLERVVLRAMEKDPGARYASAGEMAEELRHVLDAQNAEVRDREGRLVPLVVRGWAVAALLLVLGAGVELPLVLRAPFPGFGLESGLLVSAVLDPEWEGVRRGLEPYDVVVSVDGHPVHRARDVHDYLRGLPIETPVTYRIRRGEGTFDLEVPVSRVHWRDILQHYGSGYLSGLLYVLVGAVAAWRRPRSAAVHALLAFTSAYALFIAFAHDYDLLDRMSWVWRLGASMVGAATAHLGLVFPSPRRAVRRRPWLTALPYLPAVAVFVGWQMLTRSPEEESLYTRIAAGLFIVAFTALLGLLFHARARGQSLSVRQSARFMLWAAGLAFIPITAVIGFPVVLGLQNVAFAAISWVVILSTVLFPLAVAWQIGQKQLFDVDLALHRLRLGFLRFGILLVLFLAAGAGGAALMALFEGDRSTGLALGAAAGMVVVSAAGEPLWRRARRLLERDAELDGAPLIEDFAGKTRSAESLRAVVELLFDALRRRFRPTVLRLLERGPEGYRARSFGAPESQSRPAVLGDVGGDGTGTNANSDEDLSSGGAVGRLSQLGRWRAHASLVLPLQGGSGVSADGAPRSIVVLGARADGKAYSSDDAALAAALLRLASLRLDALEEIRRIERRTVLDRCLGPRRGEGSSAVGDLDLARPARGIATAVVLRFEGLEALSGSLPPERFKALLDALVESAVEAAFERGGTLHSLRGDELLFGFGALSLSGGTGEIEAIEAAVAQIERAARRADEHGTRRIAARAGVARGLVTVGTFGPAFHADCLILGGAIHEATDLVATAREGEVLVDEDVAEVVEASATKWKIERREGAGGTPLARVVRR
ncbi:protein kinase domain-containing protein [Polyangium aurulentum]|uniref:protein kinase domain-containing protein n=1 Tax=Polyangium aurulentum TaxID=2567896 RepID=UPI0010AEC0F1|nr:protein kinase [Polyangium aurulentum]UQA54566.1 protein kinase [Polyangium aurulentum]